MRNSLSIRRQEVAILIVKIVGIFLLNRPPTRRSIGLVLPGWNDRKANTTDLDDRFVNLAKRGRPTPPGNDEDIFMV